MKCRCPIHRIHLCHACVYGVILCSLLGCGIATSEPDLPPTRPATAGAESHDAAARAAAKPGAGDDRSPFHFVDVATAVGLTRTLWAGRPGKDHLLDSAGVGAAFLDYDRDGRLDIYVVNAWRLDGATIVERGRNALYRGLPDGTFEDVTTAAGVDGQGNWGSGVFVADYDDDGWPDILVTNFGPNLFYRNNGDGTFTNVAADLGVETPGWNTGAAFFDAENDGDLDLYIAGYIDCTLDEVLQAKRTLDWKGIDKVAFGPFGLDGARDSFFEAHDGRFRDRTEQAGFVDKALGFGFAVRAGDLDGDGHVEVYVANDSDPNYLYKTEGAGHFRETGLWSGAAFSGKGAAQASMGIAVGDVDADGREDLFVTHFAEDHSTFYRGLEGGFFEDATANVGLAQNTFLPMSWGTALADFDNDGDLDLVVANGHIYPQVDVHPEVGMTFGQHDQIFENRGGVFTESTATAGPGFQLTRSSRGLAVGDYDNDGDLDILLTCLDEAPVLLRNDSPGGAWIVIACETRPGEGPVIGTRVTVVADGRAQRREIAVGDSFLSTHDPRVHFGLGAAKIVERIEVRWPDGTVTVRSAVETRQHLVIRKGT